MRQNMCLCASEPIFTRAVPVKVQWRRLWSSATSINESDMASVQRANSMCRLFCHIAPRYGACGALQAPDDCGHWAALRVTAGSLLIIDPHASPAKRVIERVFFVEEIIERGDTICLAAARAGVFDGQVGGE